VAAIRRTATVGFDAGMIVLLGLLVVGGYLLVWADGQGLVTGNQLFSVWSLPLYAGFIAAAYLLLLFWTGRRRRSGNAPGAEYRYAVGGAVLFIVALIGEFVWRSISDRPPTGAEGVLSPTRLALFAATLLMLSGPILSVAGRLRAAAAATPTVVDGQTLLLALALGLAFSVVTLLTGFVHPFVLAAGSGPGGDANVLATPTDLYLVPITGAGSRRLTTTPDVDEAHPDISPDGTRLVFARGTADDYRIFNSAVDGSDARRVTDRNVHEDGPVWGPEGVDITFWSPLPVTTELQATPGAPAPAPGPSLRPPPVDLTGYGMWLVPAAGRGAAPMLEVGGRGIEARAQDGDTVCGWAFSGNDFDVFTRNFATGTESIVFGGPSNEWGCTWSPDGSRVAFHSDRDGDFEIYSAALDGSDLRQLTDDPGIDQLPRWSPDGSHIAYISSRGGEFDIYVAGADGSAPTNVTNDPALEDGFLGMAWLRDGSGIVAASRGRPYAAPSEEQTVPLGVAAIALQSLLLAGALLVALRLVPGVSGVTTIICLVGAVLIGLIAAQPISAISLVVAGLAADTYLWMAWRSRRRPSALRLAGTTVSIAAFFFVGVYFVVLAVTAGVSWSLDLVIGSILLSTFLAATAAAVAEWPRRTELGASID
jgi:TolB protein